MTLRRAAPVLCAAVPITAALAFTLVCGVDFPRHDEWNMLQGIGRAFEGTLTLWDFWIPANEHLALFPRLVIVPLALVTHWNLHLQMFVSFAFMAAAFLSVAGILARVPGSPRWSLPLAAAFLFSLHAVDTWLWACQLHVAMAVFGGVGALTLVGTRMIRVRAIVWAVGLAFLGSWSFLSGFLVWPVGAAVLALRGDEPPRRRLIALCAWIAAAGLAVGVPAATLASWPPKPATEIATLGRILEFTARYVGAGLLGTGADPTATTLAGWTGIAVLVGGGAWIALARRKAPGVPAVLGIGVFGLATGPMIALGRLSASGFDNAADTRYASFSALSWIAILLVPWLVAERLAPVFRRTWTGIVACAVAALLVTQARDWGDGQEQAGDRRAAAAALRAGEGVSWQVLDVASTPDLLLPKLADHLATLRRFKLSFFRNASPAELAPARWPGTLTARLTMTTANGRRLGRVETGGGIPGTIAVAVFTRDGIPRTTHLTLGPTGSAEGTIELGPEPISAEATFSVFSIDRDGRFLQSAPAPIPR